MKVKDLKELIKTFNDDADVYICYAHREKGKKPSYHYQGISEIDCNQKLHEDKVVKDEGTILIWGDVE